MNEATKVPVELEYRVKVVPRYIVTRYKADIKGGSVETKGEYDNADTAYEVAYALCKLEHEMIGYGPYDERIQYPQHPAGSVAIEVE